MANRFTSLNKIPSEWLKTGPVVENNQRAAMAVPVFTKLYELVAEVL